MFDWLLRSFIFGRFKHLQHLLQTVKVAKKSSRGKKLQLFALSGSKSEDDVKLNENLVLSNELIKVELPP